MIGDIRDGRVCEVLDEEGAFVHVAICYLSDRMRDGHTKFRKDGSPDMRSNIGRLMWRLNQALDGAVPLNKKDWE